MITFPVVRTPFHIQKYTSIQATSTEMVIGSLRGPGSSIPLVILRTSSLTKTIKILWILFYWTVLYSVTFFVRYYNRLKYFASNVVFENRSQLINVIINLHKEFSTGRGSRGVRIGSIKDVTVWRVPRMVTTHPRNIFLESLVEVEQRPRHDNIVIHWHQEWNSDAGKPDT